MSFAFASPRPFAFSALLAAACLAALGSTSLPAQTVGTVDPVFNNSPASGFTIYAQLFETVGTTPVLFAAGDQGGLTFINLTDNSLFSGANVDTIFGSFGRIIYTAVPETVPQPDGSHNFFVAGQLGRTLKQIRAGVTAKNILRLTPQGTVDDTFNPSKGSNGFITSVTPLADGNVLIAGAFDQFNGQPHDHIVLVDKSGAIVPDSVFDSGLSFDATVLSVATQSVGSGPFVVAGQFLSVNGQKHPGLVRLNSDGTVDGSFNPTFDARTTVVVVQDDGKILVGGDFSFVNGEAHKHLVRLNQDGSVDNSFAISVTGQPFGFINPPAVYVIKLLSGGGMYLGGNFDTVNGVTRRFLARVDANGTLDPAFDPGQAVINAVQSITVRPDSLIVGETVSQKVNNGTKFPPSLIRIYTEAPSVTLTVPKPNAVKKPVTNGAFLLTRISAAANTTKLSVYFQISGNAELGQDYNLPLKLVADDEAQGKYHVTFAAEQTSQRVQIRPIKRKMEDPPLTGSVTLTILDAPTGATAYGGVGQSQTVTITDN